MSPVKLEERRYERGGQTIVWFVPAWAAPGDSLPWGGVSGPDWTWWSRADGVRRHSARSLDDALAAVRSALDTFQRGRADV